MKRRHGPGAPGKPPFPSGPEAGDELGEGLALPEFGLAEDILAELEAQVAAREAAQARQGAAEEEPAAEPAAPSTASPEDPGRVYAFVDRLQSQLKPAPAEPREEPEIWVSFELAGEIYALPVTRVQEVLRISNITRVPHAPAPIRGITNLRGRVLAVVDLRVRLGLPPAPLEPQNRIVVVSSRDRSIGLLVDSARQVVRLLRSAVQMPPADVLTEHSDFLVGVHHLGESLVILLDVDQVLWISEGLELRSDVLSSGSLP